MLSLITRLRFFLVLPSIIIIVSLLKSSKVNFDYHNAGTITSEFAANLYGNQYIQIDCELGENQYVEKFLLLENEETKQTELQIVCGPYTNDFEKQKFILNKWAQKIKALSEK